MQARTCFCLLDTPTGGMWGPLQAQVYTGAIWGRVTDSTGGVLPGVSVILSSDRLIQKETATTSENGTFRFAELPIGTYQVTFELAGFRTLIRQGVVVDAGATMPVMVQLEPVLGLGNGRRLRGVTRGRRPANRNASKLQPKIVSRTFPRRGIPGSCSSRPRAFS